MKTRVALLGAVILIAFAAAISSRAGAISGPQPGSPKTPSLQPAQPPIVINNQNTKDVWDKINIGAAIFGAAATIASVFFAWLTVRQAKEAARQSQTAAEQSERVVRAQRLADLFEDIDKMTYLTDEELDRVQKASNLNQAQMNKLDETVGRKISTDVNIMEKIAFSWKNDLVDKAGIEQQLGVGYILLYDQVVEQPRVLWLNLDGKELAERMPSATLLRNHLAQTLNFKG